MGIDAEMFVRTRTVLTPREIRNLSVDLVAAFGAEMFLLLPDETFGGEWEKNEWWEVGDPPGRHALRRIRWWVQDGDDIKPKRGEYFIEVSLFSRYYGEGYERGPIQEHIAVASWLEARIPGCEVWYGGDSSGVCAARFDKAAREKVWAHFCEVGHRPYRGGWDPAGNSAAPACGFCGPRFVPSGGGGNVTFAHCDGCGASIAYSGDRVEVVDKRKYGREDDVFKAGNRIRSQ